MNKVRLFLLSLVSLLLVSCGTTNVVPITGRKQRLMVSDSEILSLSNQQYQEYMKTAKVSTNTTNTEMVRRVGQRLANAVTSYLNNHGLAAEVSQFQWTFNLVQDKNINAFCMPGGKIVVYEGLLPVTRDEASLAVVLGHEIAHAVAKHSAERISSEYKKQYGMKIIGAVAGGAGLSTEAQQLGALVVGLGSQVMTAGFSRKQESEADHLGLIFAAMAGYNPQVAVAFWQRMASATGNSGGSLFSDHPSDTKRIVQIQKWMPEALKYYKVPSSSVPSISVNALKGKTTKTKRKK